MLKNYESFFLLFKKYQLPSITITDIMLKTQAFEKKHYSGLICKVSEYIFKFSDINNAIFCR